MSENKNKLPRGYSIRVARSSDIFKIICFYINEIYQTRKIIITTIAILPFISIPILIYLITNISYFMALIITLLYIVSIVLCFLTPSYFCWMIIINNKECLVICYYKNPCAVLVASNYHNYSYIRGLFVSSLHRRKGLAKCLMQNALNHLKYPVYLFSVPKMHLFDFYTSLGFVFIKENQLPKELKKHLNSVIIFFPMMIEEK